MLFLQNWLEAYVDSGFFHGSVLRSTLAEQLLINQSAMKFNGRPFC